MAIIGQRAPDWGFVHKIGTFWGDVYKNIRVDGLTSVGIFKCKFLTALGRKVLLSWGSVYLSLGLFLDTRRFANIYSSQSGPWPEPGLRVLCAGHEQD